MSLKPTVARPKLMALKLRMQSVEIYMTDGELEALQAMLVTDYSSPVRDDTLGDGTKAPIIQRHRTVEQ